MSAVVRMGDCCAVLPHKVRAGKKGELGVHPVDKCTLSRGKAPCSVRAESAVSGQVHTQQEQGPVFRLQHQEKGGGRQEESVGERSGELMGTGGRQGRESEGTGLSARLSSPCVTLNHTISSPAFVS